MSMDRRRYLTLSGVVVVSGLAGCSSDDESRPSPEENGDGEESSDPDGTTETAGSVSVDGLSVPGSVTVGDEITVFIKLTNDGDGDGTYSGTLEITGEQLSVEEDVEATLGGGETEEIEAATLVPDCEGDLTVEIVDEDLSERVDVGPYPTPRSGVHDHRYTSTNTGTTPDSGPSSEPDVVREYENASSAAVRLNENAIVTVGSTTSAQDGGVRVLESDGSKRWSESLQYPNTEPALFGDRLYLVDANDLLCLDIETGETRWEFTEAGPPSDQVVYTAMYGTPLLSNGAVYFNGMHGRIWAINAFSGCEQWSTPLTPDGESNPISGVPAVDDGTLYVVGDDGVSTSEFGPLYALDAETGDVLWKSEEDDIIGETTPVNGDHVYVRTLERNGFSSTETIRAYDTETGRIDWETELDDLNTAVVVDDQRVYVGRSWPTANSSGELLALDRSNGGVEWRMDPDAGIVDAPTVGANGVFLTDWDNTLYSVAPGSGKIDWKATDLVSRSSPVVQGDRLFLVSSNSRQLTAFA